MSEQNTAPLSKPHRLRRNESKGESKNVRHRDATDGQFVTAAEATARPAETVAETSSLDLRDKMRGIKKFLTSYNAVLITCENYAQAAAVRDAVSWIEEEF